MRDCSAIGALYKLTFYLLIYLLKNASTLHMITCLKDPTLRFSLSLKSSKVKLQVPSYILI